MAAAGEQYIIPTEVVERLLVYDPNRISTVKARGKVLRVDGRVLPFFSLPELLGNTNGAAEAVVLLRTPRHHFGLAVDAVYGKQQVVIKSLGKRFRHVVGISGCAIMQDGRVTLILDADGLAALSERRPDG